jgi:RNA polymerase sigma-70 factor (ECF subfamily)
MNGMDPVTESALVARLREGDPEAFDQVYAAYHARLFNFLARLTRRRDVAEDLLEETWLRVVGHAHRLRDDTRLAPWLFTVARNLYVTYCRTRMVDDAATARIGLWPEAPAPPSPFEATAANEMQQRVERAIASLPRSYREVLLLVGVDGLTPAEAAVVCGVRPDAMRQRLSRARVLLAERLEHRGEISGVVLGEVMP